MLQTVILILFGAMLLWGVIALFRYEAKKTASLTPNQKKSRTKEGILVIVVLSIILSWAHKHEDLDRQQAQQSSQPTIK